MMLHDALPMGLAYLTCIANTESKNNWLNTSIFKNPETVISQVKKNICIPKIQTDIPVLPSGDYLSYLICSPKWKCSISIANHRKIHCFTFYGIWNTADDQYFYIYVLLCKMLYLQYNHKQIPSFTLVDA